MKTNFKKIVIKTGTNVITTDNGLPDLKVIKNIVNQIAELKKYGTHIVLVSSGAVGAGKSLIDLTKETNKVFRRQVLAAVGQIKLMNIYSEFFSEHQMHCAQVLATKEDFRDRTHYLNMKNCFGALLRDNIIPIVNENDVVSVTELMFTDNDELSGLIAAMVDADALIILSNIDGLYDGDPNDKNSKVIRKVNPDDETFLKHIKPGKSSFGRGGMQTKYRIVQQASRLGISSFIANGKTKNNILNLLNGKGVYTEFIPKKHKSNIKRWIAFSSGNEKGKIHINKGAEEVLTSDTRIISLLPIGITKIEGKFDKGDIVKIINHNKKPVGIGITQYNSDKAKEFMGREGKKALIHYDYLYIE